MGIGIDESKCIVRTRIAITARIVHHDSVAIDCEGNVAFAINSIIIDATIDFHTCQPQAIAPVVVPIHHLAERHRNRVTVNVTFHPSIGSGMRHDVLNPHFLTVVGEDHFSHNAILLLIDEIYRSIGGAAATYIDAIVTLGLVVNDAMLVGGNLRHGRQLREWLRRLQLLGRSRYGTEQRNDS